MKKILISTLVAGIMLLPNFTNLYQVNAIQQIEEAQDINKEEVFNFDNHDSNKFTKSDGWGNGSAFLCMWRADNITFNNGIMTMKIDKDPIGNVKPYSGGEYASNKTYGYGYYKVKMKPIKNDGVVSSFFTYVDKSDNYAGIAHEIDIEFTGKDTTKVEFNYFVDGISARGFVYDLGFDASEELHEYGFLWLPDSITWFVDGKEAYHTDGVSYTNYEVPSVPGKIMMNVWPGNAPGWLNPYDGKTPLTAEYDWASYKGIELEDLDLNDKIELKDLEIVASKYNLLSTSEGYKKQADFNKDGIIDIYDLVPVSKKI